MKFLLKVCHLAYRNKVIILKIYDLASSGIQGIDVLMIGTNATLSRIVDDVAQVVERITNPL